MSAENIFEMGETVQGYAEQEEVFGRYLLEKIIGRGGMGVVWKAFDSKLEEHVAIKFLPEHVRSDQAAIRDLVRETKRSRELTHPNIVRTHDLEQDSTATAIVMEYVEGETLLEGRFRRPGEVYTVAELIPIIEQIAGALDYAHSQAKIVHRDLKPANIMVTHDGASKITDFGVARSLTDTKSRMTMIGASAGTMAYMSPQQLMGEKPSQSDDIYALGATIYELLVGSPPFNSGDITTQIRHKPAPNINGERGDLGLELVPDLVENTVSSCLEKLVEDRPATAMNVIQMLKGEPISSNVPMGVGEESENSHQNISDQKTSEDRVQKKSRKKGLLMGLLCSLIVVVLGGGYYWVTKSDTLPKSTHLKKKDSSLKNSAEKKRQEAKLAKLAAEAKTQAALRKKVDRLLTEVGVLVKVGKVREASEIIETVVGEALVIEEERRLARIKDQLRDMKVKIKRSTEAYVYMQVSPEDAVIYVDGKRTSMTGRKVKVVGVGKHIIEIKASNRVPVTKLVEIKATGKDVDIGSISLMKDAVTLLAEQKVLNDRKLEEIRNEKELEKIRNEQIKRDKALKLANLAKKSRETKFKEEVNNTIWSYWNALDDNNYTLSNMFANPSHYEYIKGRMATRSEVQKSFSSNVKRWPYRTYKRTEKIVYTILGRDMDEFQFTVRYQYNYQDKRGKKASGFVIDDVTFKKNIRDVWQITRWKQSVDRERNDKKNQ